MFSLPSPVSQRGGQEAALERKTSRNVLKRPGARTLLGAPGPGRSYLGAPGIHLSDAHDIGDIHATMTSAPGHPTPGPQCCAAEGTHDLAHAYAGQSLGASACDGRVELVHGAEWVQPASKMNVLLSKGGGLR